MLQDISNNNRICCFVRMNYSTFHLAVLDKNNYINSENCKEGSSNVFFLFQDHSSINFTKKWVLFFAFISRSICILIK